MTKLEASTSYVKAHVLLWAIGLVLIGCGPIEAPIEPPILAQLTTQETELIEQITTLHSKAMEVPNSGRHRGELAMAYDANGFKDEALTSYSQAARLDKLEMRWPYLLALKQGENGNLPGALASIQDAISRDPNYPPSYLVQALWLIDLGEYASAMKVFENPVLKLRNDRDRTIKQLVFAEAHLGTGKADLAFAALEELSASERVHPHVNLIRKRVLRELGHLESSSSNRTQDEVHQISWSDPIAGEVVEYTRGLTSESLLVQDLIESDRVEDGLALAHSLKTRYPNEVLPIQLISGGLIHQDMEDEARVVLREGIGLFEHDHLLVFNLANLEQRTGNEEDAIDLYERVIHLKPDFVPAVEAVASLYIQRQDNEKAIEVLSSALKTNPSAKTVPYTLGVLHGSLGQWEKSITYFKTAIQFDEANAALYAQLALGLAELQNYEESLTSIQQAIGIDANNPTVVRAVTVLVESGVLATTPE